MTLHADSAIPAAMAVIYLLLFLYFKSIGGYKAVHLGGTHGDPTVAPDRGFEVMPGQTAAGVR